MLHEIIDVLVGELLHEDGRGVALHERESEEKRDAGLLAQLVRSLDEAPKESSSPMLKRRCDINHLAGDLDRASEPDRERQYRDRRGGPSVRRDRAAGEPGDSTLLERI